MLPTSTKRSILSNVTRIAAKYTKNSAGSRGLASKASKMTTTSIIKSATEFLSYDSSDNDIGDSFAAPVFELATPVIPLDFVLDNSSGNVTTLSSPLCEANASMNNSSLCAVIAEDAQVFSNEFKVFLIACYTLSCILAVFGNIICVFVFMAQRRKSSQSEIYVYLINLAICDIFMAIFCIPFTTVNFLYYWIFPTFFCKVVLFGQMCFVFASIGTNICVSLHRLKGILKPLDRSTHTYLVTLSLLIVWLISALVSLINFTIGGVGEDGKCGEMPGDYNVLWTWTVSTLMLFLPMVVIIFVYCWIAYLLYRPSGVELTQTPNTRPNSTQSGRPHTQQGRRNSHFPNKPEDKRSDDRRKITVTLFCVALCFCFAWTPSHVFFILLLLSPSITNYPVELNYIYAFCHLLAMSHSFHNPVVYMCTSKHFRDTLVGLVKGEKFRRRELTDRIRSGTIHERQSCIQSEYNHCQEKNDKEKRISANLSPDK